jgi:hypothetical protein
MFTLIDCLYSFTLYPKEFECSNTTARDFGENFESERATPPRERGFALSLSTSLSITVVTSLPRKNLRHVEERKP